MKIKNIFGGGASACAALIACSLILLARPSEAEPLITSFQKQVIKQSSEVLVASGILAAGSIGNALATPLKEQKIIEQEIAQPAASYVATAYSLKGRTATGSPVTKGMIAADPRVLPLGSRVRLDAGSYSGEYLVADTGSSVHGHRIDIWTSSPREAMRFGRRTIKLTVLSFGGKRRHVNSTTK